MDARLVKQLDRRLADLDPERRGYFERVVRRVREMPEFEISLNVVYLVLTQCAPTVAISLREEDFIRVFDRFLQVEQGRIRSALFSRSFAFNQDLVAQELATLFEARVAEKVLDLLQAGDLDVEERIPITFRWDDDLPDFPYSDNEKEMEDP